MYSWLLAVDQYRQDDAGYMDNSTTYGIIRNNSTYNYCKTVNKILITVWNTLLIYENQI
jgi:hypothetical protein